jgi:hypothetical protein
LLRGFEGIVDERGNVGRRSRVAGKVEALEYELHVEMQICIICMWECNCVGRLYCHMRYIGSCT